MRKRRSETADPKQYRRMFESLYKFLIKYTIYQPDGEEQSEIFWENFVHEGNELLRQNPGTMFEGMFKAVMDECTEMKRKRGKP